MIPHYVEPEQLLKANGIGETASQVVQTIMWFIGSLFLLLISAQVLVWIVAGLFILASTLLCRLDDVPSSSIEQNSNWDQLEKGLMSLTSTPVCAKLLKLIFSRPSLVLFGLPPLSWYS